MLDDNKLFLLMIITKISGGIENQNQSKAIYWFWQQAAPGNTLL